ncbi:MAG: HIT domain-containing protein [Candidatus Vogelbacteria bacterium]|nr:HIT domain-containing protein [Candidatus Vogelbacteria bacterium]
MPYKDLVNKLTRCPFCDIKQPIIIHKKTAFLTPSIAPYYKHHLLVIPKRHIISFLDMTRNEYRDIIDLLKTGGETIRQLGHNNFSVLIRDGSNDAKSVEHLHCHIIPNVKIGHLKEKEETRKVISKKEFSLVCGELKFVLNGANNNLMDNSAGNVIPKSGFKKFTRPARERLP